MPIYIAYYTTLLKLANKVAGSSRGTPSVYRFSELGAPGSLFLGWKVDRGANNPTS